MSSQEFINGLRKFQDELLALEDRLDKFNDNSFTLLERACDDISDARFRISQTIIMEEKIINKKE